MEPKDDILNTPVTVPQDILDAVKASVDTTRLLRPDEPVQPLPTIAQIKKAHEEERKAKLAADRKAKREKKATKTAKKSRRTNRK